MAPFSLYHVNPSPSSAAYMRHWTGSSLVQVMACLLFGAKPLPEPMLAYCQLDSWEHNWVKFESKFYHFHSRKCDLKMSSAKMAGVGGLGVGVGVGVWVWVWVGWGGGCRGWGAEWSVKCLLDTWLGIGANWHHKSVWYTLMSNTHMDVILWSVCYFLVYCTMCYIALFICPALSLGSKCT